MTAFNVFRRPLTVKRQTAGFYDDNGLYVEGSTTQLVIKGSIQPANGEALQALPEAQRTVETYSLFTDASLNLASQQNGITGDVVNINNIAFMVQTKQPWQNNVVSHNVYLLQKVAQ
jgi:hypothetical protein